MALNGGPVLPLELIQQIVSVFCPANPAAILPASHETTRMLIALTRVSRATYPVATKLLRHHCVYINSREKAIRLAQCLARPSALPLPPSAAITNMYLSPFANPNGLLGFPFGNVRPGEPDTEEMPAALDDLPAATAVRDILVAAAPSLRRLIIDMPLRSLYPEDDHQHVRPLLRQGFEALTELEDFFSVRDELYLNVHDVGRDEPPVWPTWKKLRRLALYNPVLDEEDQIWQQMASLPHLEVAMFTRPDTPHEAMAPAPGDEAAFDVKRHWLKAVRAAPPNDRRPCDVTFVLVDAEGNHPATRRELSTWKDVDPEQQIKVMLAEVPLVVPVVEGDTDDELNRYFRYVIVEQVQGYMIRFGLEGTLWDAETLKWYNFPR